MGGDGAGRYGVRSGGRDWAENLAAAENVELDDEAADQLDDELSDID